MGKFPVMIKKLFTFMMICVTAYFILGSCLLPEDTPGESSGFKEYGGTWERVLADNSREPVKIPGRCRAGRNETVTVETRLPDSISHDIYFCFRSAKQDMEIYVDNKLRKQYTTQNTRITGKTSAVAYVFVEIYPDDSGKILRLETKTDSPYSGIFYTIYTGSQLEIWQYYFSQYGMELIIAFIMIILSIITILGSMSLRIFYHRKLELEHLGWGILIAGLWLVFNSVFRQLIFPNLSVINDMAFYTVMLLPIPYLLYIDRVQQKRYGKFYNIIELLVAANFIICTVLHIFHICDFTDTIVLIVALCILAIMFIFFTIISEIKNKKINNYRDVAAGIVCAFISAILQIIEYFRKTSLFNGTIFATGLILLLFFAAVSTVHDIIYMEGEKQQALSANKAKDRFLASMSHEIRTPINAVLGLNEMVLRESREQNIKEYASGIKNSGQVLLSLINDILDLSKIESGKMEIIPAEYDLSSLLHDVVNMVSIKAQDKNLKVNLVLNRNLPSGLYGDDVRLRQILTNLLNNAVKYTDKGSVTLSVSGVHNNGNVLLKFEVSDTGIGIREEDLDKLFKEFERIEEKRNRNIEGTGLGLSITVRLLQMMGSQLKVQSTYGEGSRFYFRLEQKIINFKPVGDLGRRLAEQAADYSYNVSFIAPDANILVVDDNAVNRKVFTGLLKETHIKIDEADSGAECLGMASKKKYDIIFLDHMMQGIDGIETLHKIRRPGNSINNSTPVIVLTANAVTGAKEMYLKAGFNSFLSKPVNPAKLEQLVMEYLPVGKVIVQNAGRDGENGYKEAAQEEAVQKKTMTMDNSSLEDRNKTGKTGDGKTDFPEIDGINWEYAMLYLKDAALLKATVKQFYQLSDKEYSSLGDMWKEISSHDGSIKDTEKLFKKYRIQVHSMKSSASLIGAMQLSGVARVLETAAKENNRDLICSLTPPFLEEWRKMKEKLQVLF